MPNNKIVVEEMNRILNDMLATIKENGQIINFIHG